MLDHIGISVSDFTAAKAFYDAALAPIGASLMVMIPAEFTDGVKVGGYGQGRPVFWLSEGPAQSPSIHIAFAAPDRDTVDAFYQAALAAGGTDNGAPGVRPQYHAAYYGAFVRDPDGNNIEMVCHAPA
ncbi:VOC family protein [Octadecabacter sp. SW4]|uniref:VOC family protein n=1 Tax=Octadecabacter sp. SW4 TaxID=2602067 RepID=UPI0011C20CD1|nr:VOC family protein [Octadecabacter sp. SW4]QEE35012.1 VOC family protein [Octadecabacter sp. SW4]